MSIQTKANGSLLLPLQSWWYGGPSQSYILQCILCITTKQKIINANHIRHSPHECAHIHTHTERMQQTSILRSAGVPWGYGDIEAYIMCASTFSVAMPYPPRPLRRPRIRAQLHFWIRHTEQGSPCRAPLLSFAPSLGASRMPQWSLKLILRTLRITPDGMKIYHTRARYIHISTTIWCDMKYSIATAQAIFHSYPMNANIHK